MDFLGRGRLELEGGNPRFCMKPPRHGIWSVLTVTMKYEMPATNIRFLLLAIEEVSNFKHELWCCACLQRESEATMNFGAVTCLQRESEWVTMSPYVPTERI
jgi:hypothetical protein